MESKLENRFCFESKQKKPRNKVCWSADQQHKQKIKTNKQNPGGELPTHWLRNQIRSVIKVPAAIMQLNFYLLISTWDECHENKCTVRTLYLASNFNLATRQFYRTFSN